MPLLLMDVDGVLNPYPNTPEGFIEYAFFPEDDEPVRLATIHGEWLHELSTRFQVVWATSWGADANRLLCPHFDLPQLPVIAFPSVPFEPSAKVPAIEAFVHDAAVAWVDDIVTSEAKCWAAVRKHPTLLVEVDPSTGLTRSSVVELLAWADELDAAAE
jgi:hypothetical protein